MEVIQLEGDDDGPTEEEAGFVDQLLEQCLLLGGRVDSADGGEGAARKKGGCCGSFFSKLFSNHLRTFFFCPIQSYINRKKRGKRMYVNAYF
jgi:hypothetical protein